MAALLNETYFKGIIALDLSKPAPLEKLWYYSDFCEEKYLRLLLGDTLYYTYISEKTASRWVSFITAAIFEHDSKKYRLNIKQMLAYFCYFHLSQDNANFATTMGQMQASVENAVPVLDSSKVVRAYNLGVDLFKQANVYLQKNESTYEGYVTELLDNINSLGI